jgi:hypothetical protein
MKPMWMVRGGLALLVWIASVVGPAYAGVIGPIAPSQSGVTLSIFSVDPSGVLIDVTDTYLPEWAPGAPLQTVYVVVNGSATTPILVPPTGTAPSAANPNPFLAERTTSAYPGNCTNFGTDTGPDFAFDTLQRASIGGAIGYPLISNDCGGMAVIRVGNDTFVIPGDINLNGIPDSWEATFCPANSCPTGREDVDTSQGNTALGDGLSAFDEYRGFIVSGAHIRTDPRQKDLFVHLVNPQCTTVAGSTVSLLGGGPTTFVTGDGLFANLNTLISGTQIHVIGYTANATNFATSEWVDNLASYTVAKGFQYVAGTDGAISDRQINKNAVYPSRNSQGNPIKQKGLRVTECVDDSTTTLLGLAGLGTPNGPGNAVVYTQRILKYLDTTLGAAAGALAYSTFQRGAWTQPVAISHTDLVARAFEFYLSMEIGHAVKLTPAVEGTTKVSYGYHHAPLTGSNLDQTITNKVTAAGNTFYIPSFYNTFDQTNFQLK